MNNPMLMGMAQNMMQDPQMMQVFPPHIRPMLIQSQNMMGMMQGMGGMGGAAAGAGGQEELEEDGEEEPPSYEEIN